MECIAWAVSAIALLALVGDWMQTLHVSAGVPHLSEVNPILGPHPSARRVHVYFGLSSAAAVSGLGALLFLHEFGLATGAAGLLAAVELSCFVNNLALGVRPRIGSPPRRQPDAAHEGNGRCARRSRVRRD